MKYLGYSFNKVFFIPILGTLPIEKKHTATEKEKAITILAGPVPGIIIGITLLLLNVKDEAIPLRSLANTFIALNLIYFLPILPSDGGKLFETIFFDSREHLKKIYYIASLIIIAIALFYLKIYVLLLVFPMVIIRRLMDIVTDKKLKYRLLEKEFEFDKPYNELTNKEYWLIREEVISCKKKFKRIPQNTYKVHKYEKYIVNEIKSLYSGKEDNSMTLRLKTLFLVIWIVSIVGASAAIMSVWSNYSTTIQSKYTYENQTPVFRQLSRACAKN